MCFTVFPSIDAGVGVVLGGESSCFPTYPFAAPQRHLTC
jgi:hypothetical protein